MKNKKGLTLIEIIVALVILAIITLITVPITFGIKDKYKIVANRRSVDAYGKAIEYAMSEYELNTGKRAESLDGLNIKYNGKNVSCQDKILNFDYTIYLSKCVVGDEEVKDDKTNDGYYHYGILKQTDYNFGDMVKYKNENYYVLYDSDSRKKYVTLLKVVPLTTSEVDSLNVSDYVNKYISSSQGKAYNQNGYGGVAYYSSSNCMSYGNNTCIVEYDDSDIKKVVDEWSKKNLNQNDLKEDELGYKVRLVLFDEMMEIFGYENSYYEATGGSYRVNENIPDYIYNSNYNYWTMSAKQDRSDSVWIVDNNGNLGGSIVWYSENVIRPVVTISKTSNSLEKILN